MDARSTVTAKEWGSLPPEAAKFEATPPGYFLARALGPATVASPFKESAVTDTLNNLSAGITATITDIVNGHSHSDRLKSMGFRPGQNIQVLRQTSHVMHVRVGSTEWAIRNQDAELVKIIPREQSR
jgi:Fe2+ transport system protein FeoA